ncbi:helix-turn-helix transcriptional regulator [Cognatishimia sp. F0-27]|uniref:helix-turn-helix domain-containing protein n=1 Tax=Cognatishimia sp. F0-27 TaxID=2816855 RepID=UPI001D0C810A|nr:helix-turn-helix transcriptional regulator [Cognatishimia sp. F0-27]MCC1494339.1 helix-turn-helix transcriptional regulator [Cognatishimia sp. F0-27]
MDDAIDWYGPEAATFGDRLAAAREAAGMSQSDLARRLGVKLRTIQAWEQDMSEPRANKLSTTAGILNVSMVWLITGEGDDLTAPEEAGSPDIDDIMLELRALRLHLRAGAEKAARLEKRLRQHQRADSD